MIEYKANYVETKDINDAWRESMELCVKNGWDFLVKGGSYEGQIRKQLPHVTIKITEPSTRPLSPIVPPGFGQPTSDDKIEMIYFPKYIMDYGEFSYHGKTFLQKIILYFKRLYADKYGNGYELYTYGDYIISQLPRIIELLVKAKGNTNQACIAIGDISTTYLSDPPCLRTIAFKVVKGKLIMSVFFRSWDLFAGLPENLGGMQLLKEYVLSELVSAGLDVEDGDLIAYSDGLHIYEQYFELSNILNVEKIKVSDEAQKDKLLMDEDLSANSFGEAVMKSAKVKSIER